MSQNRRGGKGGGSRRGGPKQGGGSSSRGRPPQRSRGAGGRPNPDRGPARQRAGSTGDRRKSSDGLGGDQIEGRNAVVELLRAGRRPVHELLVAEDIDDSTVVMEILDLAREDRVAIQRVPRRKLDAAAQTEAHQGVMARTTPLRAVDLDDLMMPGEVPFLLVLDGITDPGNLGAILRTADVAGVTGVVLPRHRAVRITPSAAKSAAGAIEYLPIALVGGIPAALGQLADAGVWSFGLDAHGTTSIFSSAADLTGPVALVMGAEGAGLSRLVAERCDQLVTIPQRGHLDSLNVSNAAAIACFEVVRRRN